MDSHLARMMRQARENAGMSQQQIASKTCIDPSRLSRIETGRLEPTREEVMAVLEALGTIESKTLAETAWDDLKHVSAPTWNVLSVLDRSALACADEALDKLKRVRFPKSLDGHIDKLRQTLL